MCYKLVVLKKEGECYCHSYFALNKAVAPINYGVNNFSTENVLYANHEREYNFSPFSQEYFQSNLFTRRLIDF